MGEHVGQHKKATTGSFSVPTLKQPTRGFGLNPGASSQVTTEVQLKKPLGHDISRISLRSQTKLTVNQPGDVYEQEADKVAQQVMQRMSEPVGNQQSIQREELPEEDEELQMKSISDANIPSLQREALPEEDEELQMKSLSDANIPSLQREELPEEDEELQMKSLSDANIPSLQREELPEEDEELQMKPQAVGMQFLNKPLTHDISRMSLRLQRKLTVNQPGDIYEQEADKVAQQVMQRQSIQREALPEEEDELQMKSVAGSITPVVQRKGGGMAAPSDLETSIQQERGSGQPLADDVRQPMEQAFGTDFGSVKIHTDSQSDQLNQSIQARAFTTGQDIFFRQGEYAPESHGGKELLAHELTHVVQQNGSALGRKLLPDQGIKKNKIQAKALLNSPSGYQPIIQRRDNPPSQNEPDKQGQPEQTANKANSEQGQGQRQAIADKTVAVASPPANGAGAGTNSPPPDASGNPSANPNKNKAQKETQADNQGQSKPAVNQVNPEQGQNQAEKVAVVGKLGTEASSEKAPASAENDPGFKAVVGTTKEVAGQQKKHEPANSKAQEAQAAAQAPGNEVDSKAQANQVGEMGQAETPQFDAAAFKAKLMQRIADMAPKNLEETDNFKNNNKLDSVKSDLSGQVKEEQKNSQEPLEEKTKEKPDTSGIEAKKVTPLPQTNPGQPPSDIGADKAAPKSKGQGEVEAPLQDDSKKLDQQMKEADITEEQLANSNEPEFQGALAAKKDAQTNAQEAPPKYRQQEQGILATAQATAETTAQKHLQAMHGTRTQSVGQVGDQQVGAKGKDEQARAKVAGDINKIYDNTKAKVEKTLGELDGQVIQAFDSGAADAKKAFEDYVGKRMDDYKSDRYSGFLGPGKWLVDKLFGMPSEVNAFYEDGRKLYITQMDGVINKVVAIISKGLTQAKAEIASGKQEIQNYVNKLPQDLKGVGQQAAADIESKFEELQQSVDDKQDELIDTLAQKYKENLDAVDARIEEMKAANKGFIQKAFDFIVGVIKTIIELTKMLIQVLARVAGVVGQILKDPIGFLSNLIQAVKQGFLNFMNNIGKHLQQGLIGWLTGTMAETGIEIPEKFDLKGIFSLVTQVLGFTYEVIRAQAVKRLGEEKVGYLEQSVDIFKFLASEGLAGIWEFVQEKIGDLNELVLEPIKNFVIETVITAGIEWILSLLTPASAFVKAAKAIYEIIKFFMERAQQIADLINAILDAIGAIASGAIDQAVKGVENALAKSLPVVISFLASLLGLGGITGKIQAIIQKLRRPVEKAVDWIIDKGAKAFKKVGNKSKKSKKRKNKVDDNSANQKHESTEQKVKDKNKADSNRFKDNKEADNKTDQKTKNQKNKDNKTDQKTKNQKDQDNKQQDEKQHELLAEKAVAELEKINEIKDYKTLRAEKQAQAKKIEKSYTNKLKKGIKLSILFEDAAKDEKDEKLDFEVVIAPNTTKRKGSTLVGPNPKSVKLEIAVGVRDRNQQVIQQVSLAGTQEDILLKARQIQLDIPEITPKDILGKRNYAMSNIQISGLTKERKPITYTLPITNDQIINIYSSGTGKVTKEQIRLQVVDVTGKTLRKSQNIKPEIADLAPELFIDNQTQIVVANEKELKKFFADRIAPLLNNRSYSASLDKHSEQTIWQAFRLNQDKIAQVISQLDIIEIIDVAVNIHSEREMCPVCATTSNYMIANLHREAPSLSEALNEKHSGKQPFNLGTNVTSTHEFKGSAPLVAEGSTSTTKVAPPTGRTRPQKELTPERIKQITKPNTQQIIEEGEKE